MHSSTEQRDTGRPSSIGQRLRAAVQSVQTALAGLQHRLPSFLQSRPAAGKKEDDDIESQSDEEEGKAPNRFSYTPKSFPERLLVVLRLKNTLEKSKITKVAFNKLYKFVLLSLLILLAILLTPSLLPQWLGFEWATVRHLCQDSDKKIALVEAEVRNITKLPNARWFLNVQELHLRCMNESAAEFYHGREGNPPRFQWRHECTPDIAKTTLTETQCHRQEANVCSAVGGIGGFFASLGGNCVRTVGPDICVERTDVDRADAILELQRLRNIPQTSVNASVEVDSITETANERLQDVVSRLLTKVDFAADAFLLYSVLAIAVGTPLVIYRREKGSMVVSATFGMTKMWFIVLIVALLTVYDSASLIMKDTDFSRLFRNFMRDPCYVDPVFSARRVGLITQVCNEIGMLSAQGDVALQRMDNIYYDVRLFAHCKDDGRDLAEHPSMHVMDSLRGQYRNDTLQSPGNCNATELNERTSVAPAGNEPRWGALLGSGVLAQLCLKFVLTSWLLHMFAYLEPMVLHNGKVEIWGPNDGQQALLPEEVDSVCRFARDKHLLPLLFFTVLLIAEIMLIVYSILVNNGNEELTQDDLPGAAFNSTTWPAISCPVSLFA